MTELPDDDFRVTLELKQLTGRLKIIALKGLNLQSVLDMEDEIERSRIAFKQKYGAEFPSIGPFVLPLSNLVVFYRKDLDNNQIKDKITSLLKEFAGKRIPVSTFELAQAIQSLWPHYRPSSEDEVKTVPSIILQ